MSALLKAKTSPVEVRRALIIDDSHDSAQTMAWTLEALGYEAAIAHDGDEAVSVGRSFRPHVILLDINLGTGMNGYQICEMMRKDPDFENVIFIAQTGWGQEEHKHRSHAAGFQHHMVKPIKLDELKKILDAA